MYTMFTAPLFTVVKKWKQSKCLSVDEWLKKMWYMHIMGYYSTIKKEGNIAIYDNMDGP